jgi:hypothetical protein
MFARDFKFHEDDDWIKNTLPGREEWTSREGKPTKPLDLLITFL